MGPRTLVAGLLALVACSGDVDGGGNGTPDGPGGGGSGSDAGVPVDVPGGVGEPAELAGITLFHNEVRAAVATDTPLPSLTWSPALAATAAAWVAQCIDTEAPTGLVDHNPGRSDGHPYYVGENIFASGGTASARQAVDLWAAEKSNYDYATNTCNGVCGHYTQLVWRDTREVGCALGNCPGLSFPSTIVCDYGPGGNVGGARPY
ncbi:MAG TPA: CAP domain-containing protein [Kofleriaceae bacterium]|nr:CAP domain-containing protein [Kofleriaceae bacterium]